MNCQAIRLFALLLAIPQELISILVLLLPFSANFPGFYNSSHTADRFSASRISFMHDFPEMR
ncbi:hypothetical protein, partial [Lactobacillus delbrueckii]